nr:hypothetical protein [Tanacetum cinerariifolium]
KTLDETIKLAIEIMDQKLRNYAERQTDNKRKVDDSSRNNHGHQQKPAKRKNVTKVYNMGSGERKPYVGNLSKSTKCHFHHNGPCTQKFHKCNNVGHFARNRKSSGNTIVANAQRDDRANPKGNVRNAEKKGNASRDPDSNVVTGNSYDVELADGKIVGVDTIMQRYTLNFLNHPFNIDLMPIELGSFDVIIGMDWLRRCHAMIVCDEKLVRVPYGNKTLIFRDDESNDGKESRLTIISCSKAQEYMMKGLTPSNIQQSAATQIWGCYRLASRAKGVNEELLDDSLPRVIVYGYDGLPMQPVGPPSSDYITGPEEPHDPDYVLEPIYLEYIPLEDEHVFPVEEQPLTPIDSPTAESPGYVAESNPKEDPEEYEDDETEDGPVKYPMDGRDDGDDNDDDSSRDDADDEDEEEEEEHLASTDFTIVIPIASIPLPPEAEVDKLLAMPTPPPSPLTSLSPPSEGERLARRTAPSAHSLPSPMPSPLLPSYGCPTQIQTRRIASTQALIDAVTATTSIHTTTTTTTSIQTTSCLREVGYSIRDTWVDPAEAVPGIAPMTLVEVNKRVTELAELHEHDTQDLYALLNDAQEGRTRILQQSILSFRPTVSRYMHTSLSSMHIRRSYSCKVLLSRHITRDSTDVLVNLFSFISNKLGTYQVSSWKRSVNNHGHQQKPAKRKNVTKVYNMGSGERKPYVGNLSKSTKCHFHHNSPCTQKFHKCNNVGHFARNRKSSGNTIVANARRDDRENPKGNGCFQCGAPGHCKRYCPKLKNKDGEI